jgi:23S rRNA (adenine2503-C2)-methyltransferase
MRSWPSRRSSSNSEAGGRNTGVESFYGIPRTGLLPLLDRPARGGRVFQSVYQEGVRRFEDIAAVPRVFRDRLAESFTLDLPQVHQRFESIDGTRRYLIQLADRELVEAALIPENERTTFCISTQVGCALGCAFCLTGKLGLIRDLSAAEIVTQALVLLHDNIELRGPDRVSIVLMGMGEPFDNYDNTLTAIRIFQDHRGLNLPLSRITVSTAGIVPGIERLAAEPLFPNLSISLTGARNEVRNTLMPINRKYPIEEVMRAVRQIPVARQKRVMFEYVMIAGVTDSPSDAAEFARLLGGMRVKVNLIPLNSAEELSLGRPRDAAILEFQRVLTSQGVPTFIRRNRGADISSACGQLRLKTG